MALGCCSPGWFSLAAGQVLSALLALLLTVAFESASYLPGRWDQHTTCPCVPVSLGAVARLFLVHREKQDKPVPQTFGLWAPVCWT